MKQRFIITEEEHIKAVEAGNQFYKDLDVIVKKAAANLPEDLQEWFRMYLNDNFSNFHWH